MAGSSGASVLRMGQAAGKPQLAQARRSIPWMDPADAYARLRSAGRRPVLLDGLGAHPEARRSFVAFSPVDEVRGSQADPGLLDRLRAAFDRTRFPVEEGAPFTGGWVGFLGYEAARLFEPTLPSPKPEPGASPVPDVLMRLHLDAIAFDRAARTATLFCASLDGDEDAARARLEGIVAEIQGADAQAGQGGTRTPAEPTPQSVRSVHSLAPSEAAATSWSTSLSQPAFEAAVARLKGRIGDGDLFQANLATRFRAPCAADPLDLFRRLQAANPSPYMALLEDDAFAIVSGSPEQLFALEGGRVRSRPIAGTRKRGATPAEDEAMERELRSDAKEQAEHTMLVDLVRNDVAKVSRPGTVRVPERMGVERYRHVMHLVSRVEGEARPGATALDCLAALFPGGTVTGAPKHRACLRIHEAEPVPRGPYTGSLGFVSWSGAAHFSILIRTLVLSDGVATVQAGSGIVADSDPAREWKEAQRKARALLEAAQGGTPPPTGSASRLGEASSHGSWEPPRVPRRVAARVLLVDNYDSFVHNLADYCAALGAEVEVVRNDADWRAAVARFRPTHVVLSPGPGWPDGSGCTLEVAREMTGRLPLLGVCLGHQAIAQAFGGRVERGEPVHGKAAAVLHDGTGLFAGLPSPLPAARYHSLRTPEAALPPELAATARLSDGTVMALRHRRHPTYGLQFHPESICTEGGLELLARFLEQRA